MYFENRSVLVAGGAGLIGQSLVRKLLDRGAYVRATQYRNRKISITHKNLEIVHCNLLDDVDAENAFKDMEIAFLAASKVGGAKLIKEDPSSLLMYNLELHSKLIHRAAAMGMDRCAFVSSSYVYPHTGKPNVESEGFKGDPWIPMNYGLGWIKRYLETLCKHFHMTTGTDYAIVRPTSIYGPHDSFNPEECHVVPALIVKAVNGMDPFEVWGDGEDVRCFTYVDDLVEGLMLTVEKYAVSEALNVCPEKSNTVKDVVKIILNHLDLHPEVVFNSDKPSVIPYKVSDPSKAKALLDWDDEISLGEGLRRTIKWYIEYGQAVS